MVPPPKLLPDLRQGQLGHLPDDIHGHVPGGADLLVPGRGSDRLVGIWTGFSPIGAAACVWLLTQVVPMVEGGHPLSKPNSPHW